MLKNRKTFLLYIFKLFWEWNYSSLRLFWFFKVLSIKNSSNKPASVWMDETMKGSCESIYVAASAGTTPWTAGQNSASDEVKRDEKWRTGGVGEAKRKAEWVRRMESTEATLQALLIRPSRRRATWTEIQIRIDTDSSGPWRNADWAPSVCQRGLGSSN